MPLGDFKCANIVTEKQLCEMHNIRKLCNLQGFHILYNALCQTRSFQNVFLHGVNLFLKVLVRTSVYLMNISVQGQLNHITDTRCLEILYIEIVL